ncbi:MAG: Uracil-DNA glycosylase [Parcubacteria group bacterium GW2011_GWC1_45_14]|nr:MAG: Uracil-DNA glycosylase [Candidatus Moranbacteria bacterium GW2011_GWC2_45_10]KKT94747.1 MAG: Uracil-DNA glycosylase [Parcubacteria group bacterium GW2011_GWC1_45_14]
MSKKEKLDKLNKKMSKCSECSLHCDASRVVAGDGNPEARIMFIGEAPGKKEDETGIPFVGAAGKFLSEMLAEIKLTREDIYIANVVKCRPPQNRDPLAEEVSACWPWLQKQIEIIDPKLIVTLGRHSLNRFFPELKISETHGKVFQAELPKIGRRNFYALYHPAAALYNGSMREVLKKDFKKIPKILKQL